MSKQMNRARWVLIAAAAGLVAVVGCDRVKTELLAPQNPGLVDPSAVGTPTAALALRVGAIGRYKQVQAGESIWQYAGTLADEFKNADFSSDRINADQRLTDPAVQWNYNGVTQSRGFVRDAIKAMKQFNPDSSALIGELYMELAFFEMTHGRQLLQWNSAGSYRQRCVRERCAADDRAGLRQRLGAPRHRDGVQLAKQQTQEASTSIALLASGRPGS